MFARKAPWAGAAIVASACIAGTSGTANAATYYLQANQVSGSNTWSANADWFNQTSGGGSNPVVFPGGSSGGGAGSWTGNTFDTQGFALRTNSSTYTFGDTNTTLVLHTPTSRGMAVRTSGSAVSTVPNLNSQGGLIFSGANAPAISNLTVTNFINSSGTTLQPGDSDARTLNLNIGTLTGNGNFTLKNSVNNGTVQLTVGNASGYTGDITFDASRVNILEFKNDLISGGGLVLGTNSQINLKQNVTFETVEINGSFLAAGTYPYAALNSTYDSYFVDGGSGSITVVPEPGTLALLGMAGLVMRRSRRRQH